MQQFSGKKDAPVAGKNASQMVYLAIAILAMFLSGCAAARSTYRFSANAVTRITYDPKKCAENVDGTFKCKEVVFTVKAIEPIKTK
jgi:PBP1b-binding outer membrane lipoprotein LpoB